MNRCGRPADAAAAAAATTTTRARTPSLGGALSRSHALPTVTSTRWVGGERALRNFVLRTPKIRNRHFRGVRYFFTWANFKDENIFNGFFFNIQQIYRERENSE